MLALTYLLVGESRTALDRLEPLLKIPYSCRPAGSRSTRLRPAPGQPALRAVGERAVGLTVEKHAAQVRLGLELRENFGPISFADR